MGNPVDATCKCAVSSHYLSSASPWHQIIASTNVSPTSPSTPNSRCQQSRHATPSASPPTTHVPPPYSIGLLIQHMLPRQWPPLRILLPTCPSSSQLLPAP